MSVKTASAPKEVQEFQFKKSSKHQIAEKLAIPVSCSLVAADGKRGLLYIGHEKIITVLKLGNEGNIEWKTDLNLPDNITRLSLNCDSTLLAVTLFGPSVFIYPAALLSKNILDLVHEIRLSSSSGEISVCDLRWNPAIPGMLCTVTSDHTIGSFQVSGEKKSGFVIIGSGRIEGVEALCAAWSPKGKQVVVGCRNGNIIQLKPELKIARTIIGPNPNMGSVIAILWVSNFQFCATYQEPVEGRVNVLIVDAPKGETLGKFTNYEDITYGGIPTNQYYFDYIPEWGVIIAASSSSSEIAVLGTADNGITWEQWQLIDNSRAELPLVRTDESFPVGLSIDKSPTTALALNPENILPNPVPILHILATSGQLCSFHIVNLKADCPAICVPPSELVVPPPAPVGLPIPRPSIPSSEISFNLATGATSTPRPKIDSPKEKPKNIMASNFFADNSKTPGFALKFEPEKSQPNLPPPNLPPVNLPPVNLPSVNLPTAPLPKIETKINTFIQQTEPKPTDITSIVDLKIPKPRVEKIEIQTKPEIKIQKEIPPKDSIPEKSTIDDNLCLRAYREEQVNFEKELKTKLEPLIWEVGTKVEKEQIIDKTVLIDEFLRDLQETTTSLVSDIAYLRGFLIQSFAWLEETNSKNSDNVKLTSRNRRENSKLVELQELLYYTQSQLVQASKVIDLQWSEQQSREQKKMKIPNMECIYQSLMRHGQIVAREKNNIETLTKKWKSIARGNTVSDLNRSISNLHIISNSSHDSVIDLRCKTIANINQNFSREKQMKLRDFLSESAPRIIKPSEPTLIQDRLESTLSSLASMSPTKVSKPKAEQKLQSTQKPKIQSSLASLNNIVAKIGMPGERQETDLNTQQQKMTVSPSVSVKTLPALVPALASQKPKQTINISFAQTPQNLVKPFPKVEAISFGQKTEEKSISKEEKPVIEKESTLLGKTSEISGLNFSAGNAGNNLVTPQIQSTFSLQTPASTVAQNFSFTSKPAFSFASKPEEKSNLDLGGLNLSQSGLTITPISEARNVPVNQTTPAMSSINFGKAANIFENSGTNLPSVTSNFGNSGASTFGIPPASTFGTLGTNTFGNNAVNNFATPASSAPSTPTSFGTSVANTFATSGANTFGTTVASNFGNASIFGTSGGSTPTTAPIASSTGSIFGTNTFANTGTTFGKSGSIFGGSSSVSSPGVPALSSIPVSSTTVLNPQVTGSTPVSSNYSTPVITSISTLNLTPAPSPLSSPNTSSSVASSVIVSKSASISSPILASSLASPTSASTPSSVVVSTPPPNYPSPAVSLPSSTTSGLDMLSLSLTPSKTTAAPANAFQTPPTSTIFSTPAFGANSSATSTLNFGKASVIASSNVITPAFGNEQTTNQGSIFGGGTTNSTGNIFGKAPSTPNANPFGGNTLAQSPSSTSVFGNAANSTGNSIFGGSSTTGTAFGMKSTPTANASIFGMSSTQQPSVFGGGQDNTSVFGGAAVAKPQETNFSMFGGGTTTGGSSVFGQSPSFGAKPAFGASPDFGQAKSVFGSGFGAAPSYGGSPSSPGFGSPPMMGGSPPALGGTQMQKVFGGATGSNTFESLANQSGGLSFSSLAQGSPIQQQQQQHQQQQQQQQLQQQQKPPDFSAKSSFSSWR